MLEVNGVTFSYSEGEQGVPPALHEVNLRIDAGETVAIIGHNGSGKSTLSKLLAAILKPTRGTVLVDELDTTARGEDLEHFIQVENHIAGAPDLGDTVLGRGTTVIAGDGSLSDYLASLDRLRALADEASLRALLPGHGPLLADPAGTLDYYIAHRAERLAEVTAALEAGETTLPGIVVRVYTDVDRALWPFAEWSVRAQLAYLAERGQLPRGLSY